MILRGAEGEVVGHLRQPDLRPPLPRDGRLLGVEAIALEREAEMMKQQVGVGAVGVGPGRGDIALGLGGDESFQTREPRGEFVVPTIDGLGAEVGEQAVVTPIAAAAGEERVFAERPLDVFVQEAEKFGGAAETPVGLDRRSEGW